ncbi:hypothetical protein GCM10023403_41470 [Pseudonocardia benzenivorans]|nr:hypothetical protein PSD17_32670 [Pseudonocardia sp. D17]
MPRTDGSRRTDASSAACVGDEQGGGIRAVDVVIDPDGTVPPARPDAGPSAGRIVWTAVRVAASVAALLTLYYVLPLDHSSVPAALTMLLIGLAGFAVLVSVQVRWILRSHFPTLRGVEALATSVPFFLLLFAASYIALAALAPDSFGRPLTHTDSLYFTVTVFSTVGFGDITAHTQPARVLVTVQMITNLVVLGIGIRVIVGAVKRGRTKNDH